MNGGWQLTWMQLQDKLRRDEPLTMPEARWLAWSLPKLVAQHDTKEDV